MTCELKGTLMEVKTTQKNNKPYVVVYSEGKLYNVFLKENEPLEKYMQHLNKLVSLKVDVYEPKFMRIS